MNDNFDWHKELLSPETVITKNYKNTQNVRRFFVSELGENFKFNFKFMEFMRNSIGKTLKDALDEYKKTNVNNLVEFDINNGRESNKYLKELFINNPELSVEQAYTIFKNKKKLNRNLVYSIEDIKLLKI
ncbi:MAG: DUF6434 domain-containing protein [Candidatus Sericytochromatia bacterium]